MEIKSFFSTYLYNKCYKHPVLDLYFVPFKSKPLNIGKKTAK